MCRITLSTYILCSWDWQLAVWQLAVWQRGKWQAAAATMQQHNKFPLDFPLSLSVYVYVYCFIHFGRFLMLVCNK